MHVLYNVIIASTAISVASLDRAFSFFIAHDDDDWIQSVWDCSTTEWNPTKKAAFEFCLAVASPRAC
jgi:hypothetical protein